MFKAGAAIDQGTREGNLFNRQFVDLRNQLAAHPLLSGVLVEDVAAVNGAFSVGHSLGRAARGFIVVGRTANVAVWNGTVGSAPERLLYLQANGTATLTLYVF